MRQQVTKTYEKSYTVMSSKGYKDLGKFDDVNEELLNAIKAGLSEDEEYVYVTLVFDEVGAEPRKNVKPLPRPSLGPRIFHRRG